MSIENVRNRAISQNLQTNNVMKIRKVTPMKLTLAELKEVLDANANHPKAAALRTFYGECLQILERKKVSWKKKVFSHLMKIIKWQHLKTSHSPQDVLHGN